MCHNTKRVVGAPGRIYLFLGRKKTITTVSDFRYWGLKRNHENIISIYNISNHDRR